MGGRAVAGIIGELKRRPSRNWSIVVTVFGDAIVPRGGSVWLGTLLDFFRLLDVGEGAVRTAMSRLAADGWLDRMREGRNSFYRLTGKGETTFLAATREIYRAVAPDWTGSFEVVFAAAGTDVPPGAGTPVAGVILVPPGQEPPQAAGIGPMRLSGNAEDCRKLVARSWPVAEAGDAFQRFIAAFSPLRTALLSGGRITEAEAMVARVVLVHEYRRLVLRYPPLPLELLPADWPGEAARLLAGDLYHRLLPQAEAWLDRHGRSPDGPLPPPQPALLSRFRG